MTFLSTVLLVRLYGSSTIVPHRPSLTGGEEEVESETIGSGVRGSFECALTTNARTERGRGVLRGGRQETSVGNKPDDRND